MSLYLVSTGEGEALKERLVEANNKAVARNFVARDMVKVELADQKTLFRLAQAGAQVEVATGESVVEADGSGANLGQSPGGSGDGDDEPVTDIPPNDDPPEETRKRRQREAAE